MSVSPLVNPEELTLPHGCCGLPARFTAVQRNRRGIMTMSEKRKQYARYCHAVFANGRRGKRQENSTREGGRMAETGGCHPAPFKNRANQGEPPQPSGSRRHT